MADFAEIVDTEKVGLPEDEAPPMYTPHQQPAVIVDAKSVFHDGARFNEFAKPNIHPPPPGCLPNQLQQMQSEKGQVEVIVSSQRTLNHHFNGSVNTGH